MAGRTGSAAWVLPLLVVVSTAPACAESGQSHGPPDRPDLPALVAAALAANPDIQAAGERLHAARALIPVAGALPDPMLSLGYEDMEGRETRVGVSQEVPFPGKRRLMADMASREAEGMAQDYAALRLGVAARVTEAYLQLRLLRQSRFIIEKNREVLIQAEAAARAGYTVGEMAQADVFRAQAEASRSLARLATVRQEEISMTAELSRLLGGAPVPALAGEPPLVATPVQRSLGELLVLVEQAPMLRAGAAALARDDAGLALARREYLPDFEVGVQRMRNRSMGEEGYEVMLNVSVPLYFASKQRQGVEAARATRAGAAGDLEALRQELSMQVRDAAARTQRAAELIGLLEGAIIPQARLTVESSRAAYGAGRLDFLSLLNSILTLQDSELELVAEITDHEKARARLEEILGVAP